jgi:hypothetical protein
VFSGAPVGNLPPQQLVGLLSCSIHKLDTNAATPARALCDKAQGVRPRSTP